MNDTVLQIPISKNLKSQALEVSREYGFSSLQELLRVFLVKLVRRETVVTIETKPVVLSKKSNQRYNKILQDIKQGKNTHLVKDVNKLVSQMINDR